MGCPLYPRLPPHAMCYAPDSDQGEELATPRYLVTVNWKSQSRAAPVCQSVNRFRGDSVDVEYSGGSAGQRRKERA